MPKMPSRCPELESFADRLDASGDYKVLRRIPSPTIVPRPPLRHERIALLIDLETTGLDTIVDEVIEIGMLKATYDVRTGIVGDLVGTFGSFREPTRPIPAEVTRLTGIDFEMVAGQRVDPSEVEAFVAGCHVAIAHNAAFDRQVAERHWPAFDRLPWACSATEVCWTEFGFASAKLGSLLAEFGLFNGAHRAVDDCAALAELLGRRSQGSAEPVMSLLLTSARRRSVRIWADRSPFASKDILRRRGYRWHSGEDGCPRSWYVDVPESQYADELEFLRQHIYGRDVTLPVCVATALDRHSNRMRPTEPAATLGSARQNR